jgi:Lrp/AsnC family leucine-responsive transcriptional regulator
MKLDRFDKAIVQALQLDGRVSNAALAERLSLSESACLRRVRALEESGLVEGYTALINQQKAGCPVNVFVNITLDRQVETDLRRFEEAVRKIPEVMECYLMTGDYDYVVRVVWTPPTSNSTASITRPMSRAFIPALPCARFRSRARADW